MVFVPNATSGVNTVLRSLDLEKDDEILVLDHTYQACWNTVDFVTERAGAKTIVAKLPYPIKNSEQVIQVILDHTTGNFIGYLQSTV